MIRALKAADVKAAGADRLKLKDHIAVMDLIAVGRAALLPDDDPTLASALKSPLMGFDDDALMKIAARRSGSLIEALAAADEDVAVEARRRLVDWQARAKALSPFAFYALLLGQDGGRRALIGRLGPEAADPIDEFLTLALAHEQQEAPSLHSFLAQVESADVEIKRDMEVETEGVRVLTVHASKGTRGADRLLPRLMRRSQFAARTQAHVAFAAEARRSAGLGLGQEVGRRRRRGRRSAGRGARRSGGRTSPPALCRHDPCGPAPHHHRP